MRVLAAALLVLVGLSGCLDIEWVDPTEEYNGFDPDAHYRNPGVFVGTYSLGSAGPLPLVQGNLTPIGPFVVRLESNLPAYGGNVPSEDARVDIVMSIWRPNTTAPVPVIVDAGPYYEQGTLAITEPTQRTPFLLQNYLPKGYAVVQLAVRGTGTAGGCMDLGGPGEQHDLDQALTWLGEQTWSTGRIGMIGASYDGTTPWEAAATGNPYLKTIVPTSGIADWYDLMFHNGSAEVRGAFMHNQVYWGFGFSQEFPQQIPPRPEQLPPQVPYPFPPGVGSANGREEYQDRQNLLCPEVLEATAVGQASSAGAGRLDAVSTYWAERDYQDDVIANYDGSIFLIHGLQDWNVDPHAAIPFNQRLRDAGFEMKEWYGQWGHAFPDSTCAADAPDWAVLPCRLDFGDVLDRWFAYYLMGNETIELGHDLQVQDNIGFWRNADSFPPREPDWFELQLSANGRLVKEGAQAGDLVMQPDPNGGPGPVLEFLSAPLEEDLHVAGLSQLRLPFSVRGEGGEIGAWLFDMNPEGLVRAKTPVPTTAPQDPNATIWVPGGTPTIGYAQMNLLYHAGGETPNALVPGERNTAYVEFEPMEVRIPAGHRVALWVFQFPYEDRQSTTTPAEVTVHLDGEARLRLSGVDVDTRSVFPVPGAHFLNRTEVPEMYVPMPTLRAPSVTGGYEPACRCGL